MNSDFGLLLMVMAAGLVLCLSLWKVFNVGC